MQNLLIKKNLDNPKQLCILGTSDSDKIILFLPNNPL